MFIESENVSSSTLDTAPQNTSPPKTDITSTGSSKPFKIILFPPKNKEFRYDGESNSFQVHSVALTKLETATNENIPNSISTADQTDPTRAESGLTPLFENCNILTESTVQPVSHNISKPPNLNGDGANFRELLKVEKTYQNTKLGKRCFLKGCQWSPDGLCLLSNSDDNVLRLFDIPESLINNPQNDIEPVFQVKEGGTIYDYQWYPLMNSSDPISCVFASASQDAPIHLWDAYTGLLRATYQPINQVDEVTPAYSLAFSLDGSKLYSGYKKFIKIFNTSIPGRISEERPLKVKGNPVYQSNIVSSITLNPVVSGLYAVGCYDKTIGLYGEPEGDLLFILKGHSGGVTQVKFSRDGHYLFSGGRKDPEILCWDIRNPGKIVYSMIRQVVTQQKIQFDVSKDNSYLITGTTDGQMKLYNLKNTPGKDNILEPIEIVQGHRDCINGTQFHPELPLIASASGQRHFESNDEDSDGEVFMKDSEIPESVSAVENSLKIWSFEIV